MLKSTRRKLFYALVALFLVGGAGIVLYAEGWRVDFAHFRPEKVGEIYIHSYPMDADVSINGKAVSDQIGFLTRGTLVPDLLPGTYAVALQDAGYDAWHESAVVVPTLVTEFKYAVLVPQTSATVSTTTVNSFALTSNGIALQTPRGIIMNDTRVDAGTITASNPALSAFIVRRASGNLILRDPIASTTLNLTTLLAANGISINNTSNVVLDGYNANLIGWITPTRMALVNIPTQAIVDSETPSSTFSFVSSLAFSPSGAAWSNWNTQKNISRIAFYDANHGETIESSSTISGKTKLITWITGQTFAVLQTNGQLYEYDANAQTFTKRADNVVDVSISNDGTMLAAREGQSVEIFDLATPDYWRFNLPDIGAVQNLIWYHDDSHLFIVYPDHTSFLDLKDSQLFNFITVGNGTSAAYDQNGNVLYMITATNTLVRYSFPS